MTPLILLWQLSLLLCVVALFALVVLIAIRHIAGQSAADRAEARREILPMLLGSGGYAGPLRGMELEVATALTIELAELTAGSERASLLEHAAAMGVPALLEQRLQSRSAQARLTAVETLALFDGYGRQAQDALDDRNPDVRLGAALALAQRPDSPPPSLLVEKLRVGEEERSLLLVSMMSDLARRDPSAVAALLFDKDVPYDAKVAATDALADSGSEYAPLLAQMATDATGEANLQPRIFRALGKTGHPAGRAAILHGLESPEWPVRAAAAEAAGRSRIGDAAEPIGKLLADENWWVRFRAGEALMRLGAPGLAVLRAAGESADETRRTTAQAILSERRAG